jgi:hypothetical protein
VAVDVNPRQTRFNPRPDLAVPRQHHWAYVERTINPKVLSLNALPIMGQFIGPLSVYDPAVAQLWAGR